MGTPVELPQIGPDFRNQLLIGYKILRELASGFRRVHGEEPSKPSKPSVFTFVVFFRRKVCFFLEPSKPSKPSNPPVRYRQFLKSARELPWGTVKTVSFFQKGPPIGSKEHLLTPPFAYPAFGASRLYFLKYVGNKCGVRGSRITRLLVDPKMFKKILQSIRNH